MSNWKNKLYYGDNLDILKRYIVDESVDLVYLDPPFNSNANYNVLFAEKDGTKAASQIRAFDDTWTWDQEDEQVYAELVTAGGKVADCLQAFRTFLGPCDLLAYLVMMAPRLVELRRVMKPTASIYLHCDPTASHYLKLLMDAIFGPENFRNEINWVRTNAHNFKSRCFQRVSDIILFYTKTDSYTWNQQYTPYSEEQLKRYRVEPETGRMYTGQDLTLMGTSPSRQFEWRGITPPPNRVWGLSIEKLEELWQNGLILKKADGSPRFDGMKVYLDEKPGKPPTAIWADIPRVGNTSAERLGYPTQKPIALLERIILSSSGENGIVLDPFCGCGTTIDAAQGLGRGWVGIDITHLAITLMKTRLGDRYGDAAGYEVIGEPVALPDAQALAAADPYQFQFWALGLVGARPVEQKKGADKGIDGKIVFQGDTAGKFEHVVISVKAGHTGVAHVRDLRGVVERDKAAIGVLISMEDSTAPMRTEAVTAGFYESETWGKTYPRLQLLTVADLLSGKKIDMPPIRQVGATFKKAAKATPTPTPTPELPGMEEL
jgi:site-specific DNA-methyltransferase (adenine-specific)